MKKLCIALCLVLFPYQVFAQDASDSEKLLAQLMASDRAKAAKIVQLEARLAILEKPANFRKQAKEVCKKLGLRYVGLGISDTKPFPICK